MKYTTHDTLHSWMTYTSVIDSLVRGMLTHMTINPGLMERYMGTVAYDLQGKQTFLALFTNTGQQMIAFTTTADDLLCKLNRQTRH